MINFGKALNQPPKKEVTIKDDKLNNKDDPKALKDSNNAQSNDSSKSLKNQTTDSKNLTPGKNIPGVKVPTKEAKKALSGGSGDAIIDIRVSKTEQQEAELSRNGYVQLLHEQLGRIARTSKADASTFGRNSSIWIFKRNQGTCSGRLKPVIDVQLFKANKSSDFVVSGYLCDPTAIFGQYLWIRRATNDEEEKFAIIDLEITTGKMKNQSDPIWKSPDIGWVRVDGNFTKSWFYGIDTILWIRPAQTRTIDSYMASPTRGALAISDEVRLAKLLSACRLAIRHFISITNVKRLANIIMESVSTSTSVALGQKELVRSERMMDYTTLYHHHLGKAKGLNLSLFRKMLIEVGLCLASGDERLVFNFFDQMQNGNISIEEFVNILALTDYEIDLAIEKIRLTLLKHCSSPTDLSASTVVGKGELIKSTSALVKANTGVLGSGLGGENRSNIGKNVIRENHTLKEVFHMVNTKDDSIFSVDELMDLASKVEVFITEQEARKMLVLLDVNHDNRVEEADFIAFMRRETNAVINKAFRVKESAVSLRRWLVRGSGEKVGATSATASARQWKNFQKQYEKLTLKTFPKFLDSQVILFTMSKMAFRLSCLEAREVTFLLAPDKNGRIHQADLHAFMSRDARTYGELVALLERDLLKELIDIARKHFDFMKKQGKEDLDLVEVYRKKILEIKTAVENVYNVRVEEGHEHEDQYNVGTKSDKTDNANNNKASGKRSSLEVISIQQLKDGIEYYIKKNGKLTISDAMLINLEEWAALTVLVNADVAEGDIYGVRLKDFLEGLCKYSVIVEDEIKLRSGLRYTLEQVTLDLQRQIFVEAKNCSKDKKKPDYKSVFELFDENKNGEISTEELKSGLVRLHLVSQLPEHQLPALLNLISNGKKTIKLEDFTIFAEKSVGKDSVFSLDDNDIDDFDDQEDENDIEDMTSNIPPVVITQNKDCDWLLWFLYRQAVRVDSMDPESVITELEVRCNETELTQKNPAISVKELWNHLFELDLQGTMTPPQFLKGVQIICQNASGRDDDRVDYNALAKNIIRMGRSYNTIVQQRAKQDEGTFAPLLLELKKYFKDLAEEKTNGTDDIVGIARYEKIFRRLDSDGDGMLTTKEFKMGLKRLKFKSTKHWNIRMVRRLFDECDKNRDGLLSIREFSNYVQEKDSIERIRLYESSNQSKRETLSTVNNTKNSLNLSDDEDDEIFRKNSRTTDHQLMRKVNDTLMEIVPMDPHGHEKHGEVVRNSVRRFFLRADPEHRGTVSEERFRAFLRRSGLQDVLTTSELRRFTEKLKKRGTGKGESGEIVIDYERLCQQLHYATESIPKSKAEIIFSRFQEAANTSAAAGRSFISLCSLCDLKLTGKITKDEMIHISKMIDCPLKREELEAFMELIPDHAIGKDNETIDYRIIQSLLESFTPRMNKPYDIDPYFPPQPKSFHSSAPVSALPGFASNHTRQTSINHFSQDFRSNLNPLEITTPHGLKVSSPLKAAHDPRYASLAAGIGFSNYNNSNTYERITNSIIDRVKDGIEQKSKNWGAPFSIRRQFEVFDNDKSCLVSLRIFQSVITELNVQLSPSDLKTISTTYASHFDDGRINYDKFCSDVEAQSHNSHSLISSRDMTDHNNNNRPMLTFPTEKKLSLSSHTSVLNGPAVYLNSRVLQRYRELINEGNHPKEFFAAQDGDRNGMIWSKSFASVISKLQLLQTDHQLTKAIDDFSNVSNRAMVMYEEFLEAIEQAIIAESRVGLNSVGGNMRGSTSSYVNGSGYDGIRGSQNNEYWDDNMKVFDSLERFKTHQHPSSRRQLDYYPGGGGGIMEQQLDEGSDTNAYYGGRLSPPKPAGRNSFDVSSSNRGYNNNAAFSPSRYNSRNSYDDHYTSPRNSYQRTIPVPHASPSKVGSKVWGNQTPLSKKGNIQNRNPDKWCCAVCLYVENPKNASVCLVCDAPNYATRKDYQVKEQCRNCTFLNGQYADECEMCGEPLSAHQTIQYTQNHKRHGGFSIMN